MWAGRRTRVLEPCAVDDGGKRPRRTIRLCAGTDAIATTASATATTAAAAAAAVAAVVTRTSAMAHTRGRVWMVASAATAAVSVALLAAVAAPAAAAGGAVTDAAVPHPPPGLLPPSGRQGWGGWPLPPLLHTCTWRSPVRTRKEVRDLSGGEVRALVSAWRRVAADGTAEALVRVHAAATRDAHWGAQFLPWHRAFVLAMENALRKYEPTVTLPYCTLGAPVLIWCLLDTVVCLWWEEGQGGCSAPLLAAAPVV